MSINTKKIHYPKDDIWRSRLGDLRGFRAFRVKFLRIATLSLRGSFRNQLRAAALTYYSVLSVVPILALLFGIAKGFGYQKILQKQLMQRLQGQEEVLSRIIGFAKSLLENTPGGAIAGLGVVFLFYSIIGVLMSIEGYFNEIWHVRDGRPIKRKIADYLSVALIGPVLFLISSTITVLVTTELRAVLRRMDVLASVSPLILKLLNLSPYITVWLLLTFLYVFLPNTKVKFLSGALAALIAGVVFQIFQWVYITFQIGVSRLNTIYGSFAALPLFLIWLQLSWLITLIGAEISHAYQNAEAYDYDPDCKKISLAYKRLLSARVVQLLVRGFSPGEGFWDEEKISKKLGIPSLLLRRILNELIEARVVARIKGDRVDSEAFQPGRKTADLTIAEVVKALEHRGIDSIPVIKSDELKRLSEVFETFADLVENSPSNKPLGNV
ncbi:MAG: YhjD/YihY/BrkB family envelope integrity protein [Deltaproteobacteria bacterium]